VITTYTGGGISGLFDEAVTLSDTTLAASDLNTINIATSGVVNASAATTLTGTLFDVNTAYAQNALGNISGLGDEAVTLSDLTVAAADLNTLNAIYTSGTINASSITTLTGTASDVNTALTAPVGEISGLGDEAVTLSDTTLAAAVLNTVNANTTGVVNASTVTTLTGLTADVHTALTTPVGQISGLGNEAVTLSDTTLAATALNDLNTHTTGVINAASVTTLTGLAADVDTALSTPVGQISGLGNEAVTLTDTTLAAGALTTLDGKTSGTIDAATITTLTGTTADLLLPYNSAQISGLGNEAATLTDTTLAVSDLNLLDGKTSGTIDAGTITTLTGTTADVTTAYNSAGISNLGNEAVTISDTTLAAADLNTLDGKTSGIIDATTVTTLTGTTAVVTTAYNSAGISNLGNEAVTISDTTLAAADLNTLDGKTSGTINAGTVTTFTGLAADLLLTYASLEISGRGDEAVTVSDASVSAANLNTLDGSTSGVVNSKAATTVTGSAGDFGTLVAAQASGTVQVSASFNATITGNSTVAQASLVDGITTGTVTSTIDDTFTAVAAAASTVVTPATSLTANGNGAANTIDLSIMTRAVGINGLGGEDTITGTSFADSISGGSGDDSIVGGLGADTLNGGSGADRFVLTDLTAVDTIQDLSVADNDVLVIDQSDFGLDGGVVYNGPLAGVNPAGGEDIIVIDDVSYASDAAAANAVGAVVGAGVAPAVIVYFNSITGFVHVIRVNDLDNPTLVTRVAQIQSLTDLLSLAGTGAGNFGGRP